MESSERLRLTSPPADAVPEDSINATCPKATDDERMNENSAVSFSAADMFMFVEPSILTASGVRSRRNETRILQ